MNSVEETYNEVPYHLKDSAGLPFVFYKLTQDQQYLFKTFYEYGIKDVKATEVLKDDLNIIKSELEYVIGRL